MSRRKESRGMFRSSISVNLGPTCAYVFKALLQGGRAQRAVLQLGALLQECRALLVEHDVFGHPLPPVLPLREAVALAIR